MHKYVFNFFYKDKDTINFLNINYINFYYQYIFYNCADNMKIVKIKL